MSDRWWFTILTLIETLKEIVGYTSTDLDFIFVIFALFIVIVVFWYMLSLIGMIMKWVGGMR